MVQHTTTNLQSRLVRLNKKVAKVPNVAKVVTAAGLSGNELPQQPAHPNTLHVPVAVQTLQERRKTAESTARRRAEQLSELKASMSDLKKDHEKELKETRHALLLQLAARPLSRDVTDSVYGKRETADACVQVRLCSLV